MYYFPDLQYMLYKLVNVSEYKKLTSFRFVDPLRFWTYLYYRSTLKKVASELFYKRKKWKHKQSKLRLIDEGETMFFLYHWILRIQDHCPM